MIATGSMMKKRWMSVILLTGFLLVSLIPQSVGAVDSSYLDFYRSYDQVVEELQLIAQEHPDITSLTSIATTYGEHEIWAIKVSDNPAVDEDEPEVLLTGAHHAKEWPGVEVVMETLHMMVNAYEHACCDNDGDGFLDGDDDMDGVSDEDPFDGIDNDGDGSVDEDWSTVRLQWLVDNRETWFIPIVNPDGIEFCRDQVASGITAESELWRKNREPNYGGTPGQGITIGVDLNRNYGYHWGELGAQSYIDSRAEDYIGPLDKGDQDGDRRVNEDPMDNIDNDGDGLVDEDTRGGFSARETQAIRDFIGDHEFVLALNFHTFKGTIYWPWMFTLQLPEDEDTFTRVAKGMNVFNGYEYRDMSDRNQQTFSRHPPVDGDSNDWMYGKHNILSYTIELGYNSFIAPEEELLGIIEDNVGANLYVIEESDHPRRQPIELNHTPLDSPLGPGSHEVSVRVSGGELVPSGMRLYYRVGDEAFQEVVMVPGGDGYQATIAGASEGDVVEYYFIAESADQGTSFLPIYGPYEVYRFSIEGGGATSGAGGVLSALIILVVVVAAYIFRQRWTPLAGRIVRRVIPQGA
jgi:hypothetical protein